MNRMFSAALLVATLASVSGAHAADWDASKTPTNFEDFMARFNAGVFKATQLGIKPDVTCEPEGDNKGGHYCTTAWIRMNAKGTGATVLFQHSYSDGNQGNVVCIGDDLRTCNAANGKEWIEAWDKSTKTWSTTVTNRTAWPDASTSSSGGNSTN